MRGAVHPCEPALAARRHGGRAVSAWRSRPSCSRRIRRARSARRRRRSSTCSWCSPRALVGGRSAGLVTAALALVAQLYYFVPPDHGFGIEDSRSAISLIVFALAEVIVCLVGASQRDARLSAVRASGRASPPAALHLVALARPDDAGGLRRRARRGARAARRRRRAWSRSPSSERRGRDGRDVRVQRRGDRRLAPLPALTAHADRRGHRERPAGLPRRGRAGEPLPAMSAAAARPRPRCRCGSPTRRSARSDSASRAATSSTTTSASSR